MNKPTYTRCPKCNQTQFKSFMIELDKSTTHQVREFFIKIYISDECYSQLCFNCFEKLMKDLLLQMGMEYRK